MAAAGDVKALVTALPLLKQGIRARHATLKAAEHADRPRYAVSGDWGHYFADGAPEVDTRWVFDRHRWHVSVLHVKRQSSSGWLIGLPEEVADLEDSLVDANADALDVRMEEFGVREADALPAWADEAVATERHPFVEETDVRQTALAVVPAELCVSGTTRLVEGTKTRARGGPNGGWVACFGKDRPKFLGCAEWMHAFHGSMRDTPVRWVFDRRAMRIEVLHVRDVENGIWLDGNSDEILDLEHGLLCLYPEVFGKGNRPGFTNGDIFPEWVHEPVFVDADRYLGDRT
ncbi:hypothetical protein ASG43_17505 [Aureimonas sp. Leaf454]|nr:hypothetical protein ASG43_17505 [Aureimonas sp. Leaf454]